MTEALAWYDDEPSQQIVTAWRDRRPVHGANFGRYAAASTSREVLPTHRIPHDIEATGVWKREVELRVQELDRVAPDWDSYGGARLDETAALRLGLLLSRYDSVIQSAPSIALTGSGGLQARWSTAEVLLEVEVDPDTRPVVYFRDSAQVTEWEGPIDRAPLFEKWLWQASSSI